MNLRLISVSLILLMLSSALFAAEKIKKPGLMTNPSKYVTRFPLDVVTLSEVIQKIGVPDATIEVGNQTYLSYKLRRGFGEREWIYVVEEGVVTDVLYNDRGSHNGVSAREKQKESD